MDVCIFGAGAVGGHVAARLAAHGEARVAVVARGPQLQAIQRDGLRLLSADGELRGRPALAVSDPAELPPQDLVFVTLKAYALPGCAAALKAMLKPDGCVVFANNGITWWWKHGLAEPATLPLLDPDRSLWDILTPARALGCVVYSPNEVIEPGTVRHTGPNRWVLGEPDNSISPRLQAAVDLMRRAGLQAETTTDVRREIWVKLLRNAPFNTLCALTRLSVNMLPGDPQLLALADGIIDELTATAAAHGSRIDAEAAEIREVPRRQAAALGVNTRGARPSMLQDVIAGRPLEAEAILGQLQAFAAEAGVPSPSIDQVLPLLRGLDRALRAAAA